jgi:hypothetical protein
MMQIIIQVCIWSNLLLAYAKYAQGNLLTVRWVLQDLRGVKWTDPCLLLPRHWQQALLHQLVGHVLAHQPLQDVGDRISRVCTKSAKSASGTLEGHFVHSKL